MTYIGGIVSIYFNYSGLVNIGCSYKINTAQVNIIIGRLKNPLNLISKSAQGFILQQKKAMRKEDKSSP